MVCNAASECLKQADTITTGYNAFNVMLKSDGHLHVFSEKDVDHASQSDTFSADNHRP